MYSVYIACHEDDPPNALHLESCEDMEKAIECAKEWDKILTAHSGGKHFDFIIANR